MFTIHLNKLRFHARHGIHDEEAITGSGFELDVAIRFPEAGKITGIAQTVNYVDVYTIIRECMMQPVPLLETLAADIAQAIHELDGRITGIDISISKLNPPIEHFTGNVGVSFTKEY